MSGVGDQGAGLARFLLQDWSEIDHWCYKNRAGWDLLHNWSEIDHWCYKNRAGKNRLKALGLRLVDSHQAGWREKCWR